MATYLNPDIFSRINEPTPQLYIVCSAAKEAGKLHGVWVDATLNIEAINEEIKSFLAKSPVPGGKTFEVQAYKGFYSFELDKDIWLGAIRDQAAFISKYGALGAAVLTYYDKDILAAEAAMIDQYQGEYEDELDYVTRRFHAICLHSIPKDFRRYINYSQYRKDLFKEAYFSITLQGVCHVFSGTPARLDDEEFDDFGP